MARVLPLLALGLAVAVLGARSEPPVAPRAAATASSGSVTHSNSRAGLAIFGSPSLAPGHAATGSVTIKNTGGVAGLFRVAQDSPVDLPGPAGGVLSSRLLLVVRDATAGRTVYSGPLASMGARDAGRIEPGASHTYAFSASLPPALPANPVQASSTSVRYVWTARAAPATSPPPVAPPAPADTTPPRVKLRVPRVQRVLSRGYVVVRARCNEACSLRVRGRWRIGRMKTVTSLVGGRRAQARRWVRLQVGVNRAVRRALRRALLGHRPATLRLYLAARDRVGNERLVRRRIIFRRVK